MINRYSGQLRWLKNVGRRLRGDMADDLRRQEWWAKGVSISPFAIVNMGEDAILEIGHGTLIGPYVLLDLLNDPIVTDSTTSSLRIGQNTAINEFSNIRAAGSEIIIGNDCLLAQFVAVIGSNHSIERGQPMCNQPWDMKRAGVRIGNDVWIGTHAVVLPGIKIGNGAVIAAGAVVNRDIPDYAVAAGVPAQVKSYRK